MDIETTAEPKSNPGRRTAAGVLISRVRAQAGSGTCPTRCGQRAGVQVAQIKCRPVGHFDHGSDLPVLDRLYMLVDSA